MRVAIVATVLMLTPGLGRAAVYEVGPGQALASIGEVPWESLEPGDLVRIHWREAAYHEKWVLCRRGTAEAPIVVQGVPGPGGERPVIDGRNATTRGALNYWGEERGLLKIGGASVPGDLVPAHIVIENLELRSARPPFTFTSDAGQSAAYAKNAAALYVEKAEHLVIRNCVLRDSGNGLFIGVFDGATQDVLVEGNTLYDNGLEGSYYEHNSYTAALGIVFQFNRYGPLRAGAGGNNLKDRSAGTVVRYNWIEGGNRQLDLVDGEDSGAVVAHPSYEQTFVYGNVLFEPGDDGNSQIAHYGGDSGVLSGYRKGTLHFYNNTVVSLRSGNTTLLRLSSQDESAQVFNNVVYASAGPGRLAILDDTGAAALAHNWLSSGWVGSHGNPSAAVTEDGANLAGAEPGLSEPNFALLASSACVDSGRALPEAVLPAHTLTSQYRLHAAGEARPVAGPLDLGAFEHCGEGCAPATGDGGTPDGGPASVDGGTQDGGPALADGGSRDGGAPLTDGGSAEDGGSSHAPEESAGCACAPDGAAAPSLWAGLALLFTWLRRRR